MLSRIANSLFWMGRYLERVEHLARFAKVQHLTSLDAPASINKKRVLASMLEMAWLPNNYCNLRDEEVLFHVSIANSNRFSMLSVLNYARENARGARDTISSELWEAINTSYHQLYEFNNQEFEPELFVNIVETIISNSAIIKGLIDNTLFHRDERALICEGMHIERAIMVSRIMLAKLNDISLIENSNIEHAAEAYQWGTLLKCAESFDMCHRFYRKVPNRRNSLEFLLFNNVFPKSVFYNLLQVKRHLEKITNVSDTTVGAPAYILGKLLAQIQYSTIDEVDGDISNHIARQLNEIYNIASAIEQNYLSY
ncbi:MAG: hypothetical protein RLZZ175_2844 [Bacteroidota bacterium]|jgi:uncharacterized alpha-E superfamily protein